jgi:hypothetical protein
MYELSADDPLVRSAKVDATLTKAYDALAALKVEYQKFQARNDATAFDDYVASFDSLGRPPLMSKSEFVAGRRTEEVRADLAKAADADDLLPERRAARYGRMRT